LQFAFRAPQFSPRLAQGLSNTSERKL